MTRPTAAKQTDHNNYLQFDQTIRIEYRLTYEGSTSQTTFDDLLDAILASMTNDDRLGATVDATLSVRLTRSEPALFYQRLVHYGEILVGVEISL